MTRSALLLAALLGALVWVGGALPGSAGTHADRALYSAAVGGRLGLMVYLPARYDDSHKRYPVVYFLHGLPAASGSYRSLPFVANALRETGRAAILVTPQGARDADSDPEYLDWGSGRNWETAITRDVVHYVDAHYRTIPNRNGRAIVGLSAGGYGAVLLALHHLPSFSVVESWSGYFHPTNPAGTRALDLGSQGRNKYASAHTFVRRLRSAFVRRPTFFAFYVGRGDDRFRDENEQLNRELNTARVSHVFQIYTGGHQQSVWQAHATGWLDLALRHLTRAH